MLISKYTKDGVLVSLLKPRSEKILLAECDKCKIRLEIINANYTTSQKRRNYTGITLCRKCASRESGLKKIGKPSWKKGKRIKTEDRIRNPYISSDGYKMVFDIKAYDEDFKNNKAFKGYRKEHRIIIEKVIGREILKTEDVHHINGDKLDNRVENLILVSSSEHKKLHHNLMEIAYGLVKQGIIIFDNNTKKYMLK